MAFEAFHETLTYVLSDYQRPSNRCRIIRGHLTAGPCSKCTVDSLALLRMPLRQARALQCIFILKPTVQTFSPLGEDLVCWHSPAEADRTNLRLFDYGCQKCFRLLHLWVFLNIEIKCLGAFLNFSSKKLSRGTPKKICKGGKCPIAPPYATPLVVSSPTKLRKRSFPAFHSIRSPFHRS